jgi:hypothetical protein
MAVEIPEQIILFENFAAVLTAQRPDFLYPTVWEIFGK